MVRIYVLFFLSILYLGCNTASTENTNNDKNSAKDTTKINNNNEHTKEIVCKPQMSPFMVIEFFSYEGCKSCAKADTVINSLIYTLNTKPNAPLIMPVAAHVNRDSAIWYDTYSLPKCDSIQEKYCQYHKSMQYTPQVVLNGEVVTFADPRIIQQHMSRYLKKNASFGMCIVNRGIKDSEITVGYQLTAIPPNSIVRFMLIESGLTSTVTAGDNKGKSFVHDNVIRVYKTISAEINGEVNIKIPKKCNVKNCEVVAYVQNTKTLQILTATRGFKLKQ